MAPENPPTASRAAAERGPPPTNEGGGAVASLSSSVVNSEHVPDAAPPDAARGTVRRENICVGRGAVRGMGKLLYTGREWDDGLE